MSAPQPLRKVTSTRDDALRVVRGLVDAGHVAYLAGGCVRDMLLGREAKDFDVATSATPDVVRQLFPRSEGVGQAFGVVIVRVGRSQIEVATFRADGHYSDGRRPDDVRFAGDVEDARRRDFTINGLFYDPLADRVIDHVGGQADLAARVLRAIGDPAQRFAEDYLRMLRAARFAARYDFEIDAATRDAIVANAPKLARIAPERIADELRAMLTAPSRAAAVRLLDELTLSDVIFRDVTEAGRRSDRYLATIGGDAAFPLMLAAVLAARCLPPGGPGIPMLTDARARAIEAGLRRVLRLSNDELAAVRSILSVESLVAGPNLPRVATLKRFLAGPHSPDARRLLAAMQDDAMLAARVDSLEAAFAAFGDENVAPPPLVTGDDLTAMGFPPGRQFKVALDATYDAQLEHAVTTREDALAFARVAMRAPPQQA